MFAAYFLLLKLRATDTPDEGWRIELNGEDITMLPQETYNFTQLYRYDSPVSPQTELRFFTLLLGLMCNSPRTDQKIRLRYTPKSYAPLAGLTAVELRAVLDSTSGNPADYNCPANLPDCAGDIDEQ